SAHCVPSSGRALRLPVHLHCEPISLTFDPRPGTCEAGPSQRSQIVVVRLKLKADALKTLGLTLQPLGHLT
ncbi:MAG: hypothetical protein WD396_02835, partial [Pseudohongiellaceae bacterium]